MMKAAAQQGKARQGKAWNPPELQLQQHMSSASVEGCTCLQVAAMPEPPTTPLYMYKPGTLHVGPGTQAPILQHNMLPDCRHTVHMYTPVLMSHTLSA